MKTPLILIAMLPLAGCISFGAKPPPTLLTLTSASSVPVGQTQNSATAKSITIQVPVVPQSLATARVPVQATPTSIAYVTEAQWAEPPARLFARLVSDTVAARTGYVVLSTVQSIGDARPGLQAFSKTTIPEANRLVHDLRTTAAALSSVAEKIDQQGASSLMGQQKLPDYKGK